MLLVFLTWVSYLVLLLVWVEFIEEHRLASGNCCLVGREILLLLHLFNSELGAELLLLQEFLKVYHQPEFRFFYYQLFPKVIQKSDVHFREWVKENCFQGEAAASLFEHAGLCFFVLVLNDVKNCFHLEVIEHRFVCTLHPPYCLRKVSHCLGWQLVERQLGQLGIEILKEDVQLWSQQVHVEQDQWLAQRIFHELEGERIVEGAASGQHDRQRCSNPRPIFFSPGEVEEVDVGELEVLLTAVKPDGLVVPSILPKLRSKMLIKSFPQLIEFGLS